MLPMLKPLVPLILVSTLAALPASGQRGSAGHGGGFAHSGGGVAAHAATSFHSGPALVGHSTYFGSPHPGAFGSNARIGSRPTAVWSMQRYSNGHDGRQRRSYDRFYPVGVPYAAGWIGPGYLYSFDSGVGDDLAAAAPPPGDYADGQNALPPPPVQQAEVEPAPVYRSAYVRPQPETDPGPDTAVTLIFKDGRPSEQIHNYMLTRTTLYVQDQHPRRIPIDQIDLAATSKANLDAGVDFRLPDAIR
jgi:hypothetical protein